MRKVYALGEVLPIKEEPDIPIFLVGPTPRSSGVPSWRPNALKLLRKAGFGGSIYIPEDQSGEWKHSYMDQVEWEHEALEHCRENGAILAWVPRHLETMPSFTTNVEFGLYVKEDSFFYGRPNDAPKNRYLDWAYKKFRGEEPSNNLSDLIKRVKEYVY